MDPLLECNGWRWHDVCWRRGNTYNYIKKSTIQAAVGTIAGTAAGIASSIIGSGVGKLYTGGDKKFSVQNKYIKQISFNW